MIAKPSHICHISQSAGGVETYILNILRYADKEKFRHTVICSDNGTLAITAKDAGAKVIYLPMVREISPIRDLSCLIKLVPVIRGLRPDIIHAHSGKGGIFGRLCGIFLGKPVAFTPHGFSYLGQQGIRKCLVLYMEKALRHPPAFLLATSPSEARRAVTEVGWSPEWVSSKFPNSLEVQQEMVVHTPKEKTKVLMVGRLSYPKNPEMFLRVAKLVGAKGRVTFTILGAGYGSELEEKIIGMMGDKDLQGIVNIKPWCKANGVKEEMLNADIYISTSRYESFGFGTAEAIERGLPVIATRIDGNVDLVDHGKNGFLVQVDDDAAMADYIAMLSEDYKLRQKLSVTGRGKIDNNYNIEKNIKKLEEIYYFLSNYGK